MNQRNNFGALSSEYESARRGYPAEVYEYLKSLTKEENPRTLDLGCGTGLATRELKEFGFDVIGADKDAKMIEVAKKTNPEIEYVVAPADNLPFEPETFDVITAFTAFHWFANEQYVEKFKKLLKPGGVFFAALKDNRVDDRMKAAHEQYREIVKKYAGPQYNSAKNYDPEPLLKKCGFGNVEEEDFQYDEWYTVDGVIKLIQSYSFWNIVPEEKRPEMVRELRELYGNNLINGLVLKPRVIDVVAGFK
ncbi:MAG: SAM-dependent methyltransferase [Candidatus Taylorbacteria bacterium]|nr:SAM-dependent methyltransferase [Candidatus Taylorbacteria bacterium]